MAMKLEELVRIMDTIAPIETQEEWDNSGIQLALNTGDLHRILICLEITKEVIEEAEEKQVDMIITHHPLIFGSLTSIDYRTITGAYITKLANLGISVYSSHTPFDKVEGGNNDYIADLLELRDTSGFSRDGELDMIGRVGQLFEPMSLQQLVQQLEIKLDLEPDEIRVAGDKNLHIKTVGICTGAGADLMETAVENGCQVLVTGDVKYHDAQNAKSLGFSIIDAGHYGTEKFFTRNFAQQLREKVGLEIEVMESEVDIDPFL